MLRAKLLKSWEFEKYIRPVIIKNKTRLTFNGTRGTGYFEDQSQPTNIWGVTRSGMALTHF
jgi:hypothetical protein